MLFFNLVPDDKDIEYLPREMKENQRFRLQYLFASTPEG